jgi:hypothetical protein
MLDVKIEQYEALIKKIDNLESENSSKKITLKSKNEELNEVDKEIASSNIQVNELCTENSFLNVSIQKIATANQLIKQQINSTYQGVEYNPESLREVLRSEKVKTEFLTSKLDSLAKFLELQKEGDVTDSKEDKTKSEFSTIYNLLDSPDYNLTGESCHLTDHIV